MPTAQHNKIWVLVKVEKGLPAHVEAFRHEDAAWERLRSLRPELREEYDAADVFEVEVQDGPRRLRLSL